MLKGKKTIAFYGSKFPFFLRHLGLVFYLFPDTEEFIDALMEAVRSNSYMQGRGASPPPSSSSSNSPVTTHTGSLYTQSVAAESSYPDKNPEQDETPPASPEGVSAAPIYPRHDSV